MKARRNKEAFLKKEKNFLSLEVVKPSAMNTGRDISEYIRVHKHRISKQDINVIVVADWMLGPERCILIGCFLRKVVYH